MYIICKLFFLESILITIRQLFKSKGQSSIMSQRSWLYKRNVWTFFTSVTSVNLLLYCFLTFDVNQVEGGFAASGTYSYNTSNKKKICKICFIYVHG